MRLLDTNELLDRLGEQITEALSIDVAVAVEIGDYRRARAACPISDTPASGMAAGSGGGFHIRRPVALADPDG